MRAEQMGIADQAHWYYGTAESWQDAFPVEDLSRCWSYTEQILKIEKPENLQARRAQLLRASLLKLLHKAIGSCTACDLYKNRLSNRPVVDDGSYMNNPFEVWDGETVPLGAYSAEIAIIGEGAGGFEQRTGVPFVSYSILSGSFCARECTDYSKCYSAKSEFPQQPCSFVEIDGEKLPVQKERANATPFTIHTAGGLLDRALLKANLWREGWNSRLLLMDLIRPGMEPRPGSVYIMNATRCRATDDKGKDRPPTAEEVATCRRWLEAQLYIVQPKVLLALGAVATTDLVEMTAPKMLTIRGSLYRGIDGLPVLVEVHPAYALRLDDKAAQAKYVDDLAATLEKAKQIAAGTYALPWEDKPISAPAVRTIDDPFEGDGIAEILDVLVDKFADAVKQHEAGDTRSLRELAQEEGIIVDKFTDICAAKFLPTFTEEQRAALPG